MAPRSIFGWPALLLLAGGVAMQFFVILSGAVNSGPETQIYFLQTTTHGITPKPRNPTRWTYFALCGESGGKNVNCGSPVPALPFDPPRGGTNFGTTHGVPSDFVGTHYYYFVSRFAWVFTLLALVFAVFSLFLGPLAVCTRVGGIFSALVTIVASAFQVLAAALTTDWVVKGRNVFRSNGQDTSIGVKAIALTWAAFAAYFLAAVLFFLSGASGSSRSRRTPSRRGSTRRTSSVRDSKGRISRYAEDSD